MYRIGLFSILGRVTIKTLHHYDDVGLLVPSYVDEETGYRYYTTSQLFQLNKIVALRQMGFAIPEISAIIDGHDLAEICQRRKNDLESEMHDITEQLFRLNHFIEEYKEGQEMKYQAVIKEIPSYIVFSAKCTIPNYAALNQVMPALGKKVSEVNPEIKCSEPNYCFNVYLDGEYRETDINVEICQAVTSRGRDGDGFIFKEIPAITVVSVLHRGIYTKLGDAYAYAMQWVEQNGYQICDHVRESYIDGIWNKDNVDDWLTEIQVPVEKNNR